MKQKSLLTQTQTLMRRAGLRARKELGQNFLVDEDVLGKIISASELTSDDVVLEVGPGLGVLTEELSKKAGLVIAVELDESITNFLKNRFSGRKNVTSINEDILKTDVADLLLRFKATSYKVVANLPYYITSPVLRLFLEAKIKPGSMVVMVQKEVAEEITAKPGKMSLLSIGVQVYGKPEIISQVPATSFYPVPKVDSAILKIMPYSEPPITITDTKGFFTLVRAGFSQARKQLANPLSHGLEISKDEALALLAKSGIDSKRRAESLSIAEWERLREAYETWNKDKA